MNHVQDPYHDTSNAAHFEKWKTVCETLNVKNKQPKKENADKRILSLWYNEFSKSSWH